MIILKEKVQERIKRLKDIRTELTFEEPASLELTIQIHEAELFLSMIEDRINDI